MHRVKDAFEQKLALFLMQFGDWPVGKPQAEVSKGQLISFQISASMNPTDGQKFAIVSLLSRMISRQYNELTAPEGVIERLTPSVEPGELGILIPPDYKGDVVRLWNFTVLPNYK